MAAVALAACQGPKVASTGGSDPGTGPAPGRPEPPPSSPTLPPPGSPGAPPSITLPDAAPASQDAGPPPSDKCAGEAHAAKTVPVDLYMLVDISGSMLYAVTPATPGGPPAKTKWDFVREAMLAFFADPKSAGLGVGLQFFPLPAPCKTDMECSSLSPAVGANCRDRGVCTAPGMPLKSMIACDTFSKTCPAGTTCVPVYKCAQSGAACTELGKPCDGNPADMCVDPGRRCRAALAVGCMPELYKDPALPIGELPAWEKSAALTIASVSPGGSTPMTPAVAATIPAIRAQAAMRAGRKAVFVLATDGLPTGCGMNTIETVAAALEAGQMTMPALPTYVIGVFAASELQVSTRALNRLAMAGGTGTPFVIEQGMDLTQKFQQALEQIRGTALACEFEIPKPMNGNALDFGKVNVRFTPGGGMAEDLAYVGAADRCDPMRGGWYYDVDPKMGVPTRILVCDSSCKRFKADAAGAVELQVGCTTIIN